MYPPIFQLVDIPAVRAVFGSNPVRVWPFGRASKAPALPYAVHQLIAGNPENYLSGRPDMDGFVIQIDVYADEANDARHGAEVLRDALELAAHIDAWRGEDRDPATNRYRYSFDVAFQASR